MEMGILTYKYDVSVVMQWGRIWLVKFGLVMILLVFNTGWVTYSLHE